MAKRALRGDSQEEIQKKYNDKEKKVVGIVGIVTGDKVAKLTMKNDKTFSNGESSIKIDLKNFPARPKLPKNDHNEKLFRVRMNEDCDGVEVLSPVEGDFDGEFVEIAKKKDGSYVLNEKVFAEGTKNENRHLEFMPVYKITSGPFNGVELPPLYLHYKFEQDPRDENFTKFNFNTDNPKATRGQQLLKWGDVYDLWQNPIPWPDDGIVLETLEDRILENNIPVRIHIERGYPQYISNPNASSMYDSLEEVDAEGLDEVDATFPQDESVVVVEKIVPAAAKKVKSKKAVEVEQGDDL